MAIKNKAVLSNNILPIRPLGKVTLSKRQEKQQGVVLIVALVFLVALTAVAAALMQNTTSDMKMTGASNEKVIATQAAISAIDEVIDNQLNRQETSVFSQRLNIAAGYSSAQLLPTSTKTGATASLSVVNNPTFEELPCPRDKIGNEIRPCNIFQLQVQRLYGRNNTSTIVVNTTIAQQLLSNN